MAHTLTVGFTPSAPGTYSFYYKTVATSGFSAFPLEWSPDSGQTSVTDQQKEWVYVGTITGTIPISIALLNDVSSNPISGANHFTADYVSGGSPPEDSQSGVRWM